MIKDISIKLCTCSMCGFETVDDQEIVEGCHVPVVTKSGGKFKWMENTNIDIRKMDLCSACLKKMVNVKCESNMIYGKSLRIIHDNSGSWEV